MIKEKKLILSVDDEADIRKSIKDLLEDEGFAVKTAIHGKDCLNQLKKIKPNLILLDILMPGLTTKEILKGIKKINPKVPIIFLTVVKLSEATQGNLIGAKDANIVDFIEKPFDNNELIKRIKKALK